MAKQNSNPCFETPQRQAETYFLETEFNYWGPGLVSDNKSVGHNNAWLGPTPESSSRTGGWGCLGRAASGNRS